MRNYYKTNSHYLTYTLSLKNVGRMYFLSLGVKGLIAWTPSIIFFFHVSLTSFPVPHHNWVAALADFLLQLQHAIQQGLGSGWTARDVDVDRNNAITATDNSIRIMIVASTIRTAAIQYKKDNDHEKVGMCSTAIKGYSSLKTTPPLQIRLGPKCSQPSSVSGMDGRAQSISKHAPRKELFFLLGRLCHHAPDENGAIVSTGEHVKRSKTLRILLERSTPPPYITH